jgi:hypothetical protein
MHPSSQSLNDAQAVEDIGAAIVQADEKQVVLYMISPLY